MSARAAKRRRMRRLAEDAVARLRAMGGRAAPSCDGCGCATVRSGVFWSCPNCGNVLFGEVSGVDLATGPDRTAVVLFHVDVSGVARVLKRVCEVLEDVGRAAVEVGRQIVRVFGAAVVREVLRAARPRPRWDRSLAVDARPRRLGPPPGSASLRGRAAGPFWLPRGGCGRRA